MRYIVGLAFGLFISNCIAGIELHVFVSFSMPESSIVALSHEASSVNALVNIRGIVNKSFQDTVIAISDISKKTGWGMSINPEGFSSFGVSSVPCFVLADVAIDGTVNRFDKVFGNITLEYALEEFYKRGELSDDARNLLGKFRGDDD